MSAKYYYGTVRARFKVKAALTVGEDYKSAIWEQMQLDDMHDVDLEIDNLDTSEMLPRDEDEQRENDRWAKSDDYLDSIEHWEECAARKKEVA